jgi:(2Fe-2S) ferredoxin
MHGLLGRQRNGGQPDRDDRADRADHEARAGDEESGAIKVSRSKCLGPCAGSPLLCVYPQGDFYWGMSAALLPAFVDEVLVGNGTLPGHTIRPGERPR